MTDTIAQEAPTVEPDQRSLLAEESFALIGSADFRSLWPMWARLDLVKAANTFGEMPEYAVPKVKAALKVARKIERDNDRLLRENEAKKNSRWH